MCSTEYAFILSDTRRKHGWCALPSCRSQDRVCCSQLLSQASLTDLAMDCRKWGELLRHPGLKEKAIHSLLSTSDCGKLHGKSRVTGKSTDSTWQPEDQWLPAAHQTDRHLTVSVEISLIYISATMWDHLLQLLRGDFSHMLKRNQVTEPKWAIKYSFMDIF